MKKLFDCPDQESLRIEILAWIETLSSFRTPVPGYKKYPNEVQRLLASGEQFLRRAALAQPFDRDLAAELRQYVQDLLSKLGGLRAALYAAFTIKRTGLALTALVDEAEILAQEPMSSAEKEELRTSLLNRVQSYSDKLDALKRNLDAGDAKGLDEGTTSQPKRPPIKPPSKRKARKRKRSGN